MSIHADFRVSWPELINNGSASEMVSLLRRIEAATRISPEGLEPNRVAPEKLHGSARTTTEQRRAIQGSNESLRELAKKHGIDPKTAQIWRSRSDTADMPMGPKNRGARKISKEQEDEIVRFYLKSDKSIDECLKQFKKKIPQLTRSTYYRCIQRATKPANNDKSIFPSAKAIKARIQRHDDSMRDFAIYVAGVHRG